MLGLTLCYEDEDEEGNTEIFIDDIAPSGLAARDDRLRLGDQIIQVREGAVLGTGVLHECVGHIEGLIGLRRDSKFLLP